MLSHMSDAVEMEPESTEALADAALADFKLTNEFALLEKAIEHLTELIENCSEDDEERVGWLLYKYARCLQERFERGKDPAEIATAIDWATRAVGKLPPDLDVEDKCLEIANRTYLLSKCLVSEGLCGDCEKPESLEKADAVIEKMVEMLEDLGLTEGPTYFLALRQQALCKQLLFDRTDEVHFLERSLILSFRVLDWYGAQHEADDCAEILGAIALRLLRAHWYHLETGKRPSSDVIPDDAVLEDMIARYLMDAEDLEIARQLTKLDNVVNVTNDLIHIRSESRRAILRSLDGILHKNVQRFKDVMETSLQYDVKAHALRYYGLPRLAAAAALEAGKDAFTALCILEEGRDITGYSPAISEQVQGNVNNVDASHGNNQYLQLRRQLEAAIKQQRPYSERQAAMRSVRAFEESADSPHHLTLQAVTGLATAGPIVVLNITDVRSDAIVITHDGVEAIFLPNLMEDSIGELSWEIQRRLAKEEWESQEKENKAKLEIRDMLNQLLESLWRNGIKTILDSLGYVHQTDGVESWPRVCWIPTGVLSLYPIGAAGLGLGKKGNAYNRVISTYAPSIKALMRTTERPTGRSRPAYDTGVSTLVLEMVDTEGTPPDGLWINPEDAPIQKPWPRLQNSEEEAKIVQQHFPSAVTKFEPTTEEVLKSIRQAYSIVHFSCHGHVNYIDPTESMLLFKGWKGDPLTVGRIGDLNIDSDLAFLSACFTANGGIEGVQDEPKHMTASLHAAGFRNVVGSLWYVSQEHAMLFVKAFYQYLAAHSAGAVTSRSVAEATHVAMMDVAMASRTTGNRNLGDARVWVPFICVGI